MIAMLLFLAIEFAFAAGVVAFTNAGERRAAWLCIIGTFVGYVGVIVKSLH